MWTLVRFALLRERDYCAAFELLAEDGLLPLRAPLPGDARPYPGSVAADLRADTAPVTRAVFERLAAAGLAPMAVMACTVDLTRAVNSPRALAHA